MRKFIAENSPAAINGLLHIKKQTTVLSKQNTSIHIDTHRFNGPLSSLTRVIELPPSFSSSSCILEQTETFRILADSSVSYIQCCTHSV